MEILLWWLPPAIVTLIAMLWVSWLGRARDLSPDRSDAAQERFAAAIMKDLPLEVTHQVSAPRPLRERSTGIAVRPSQMPVAPARQSRTQQDGPAAQEPGDGSRRSA